MKKILALVVTASLLMGTSTVVFAEGNEAVTEEKTKLTEEQKQARSEYIVDHAELMKQLTELRAEVKTTVEANHKTLTEVKEKLKAKAGINEEVVTKLKELAAEAKPLIEEVKQIHQQRVALRSQYKEAVKAKDLEKMKSLKQQMTDLNSKVESIKSKLQTLKTEAAPIREEVKAAKDTRKQLKESLKPSYDQAKAVGETINALQTEKQQLWKSYEENIKSRNYAAAEENLKSIIAKKAQILDNLKKRGAILSEALASLS